MKLFFRLLLLIMFCIPLLNGKTVSSAGNGKWSAPATWDGGIVPAAIDTVIIAAGNAVTIDTNYTVAMITIKKNAALQFDGYSGDIRRLTSNSDVVVEEAGKILPSGPFTTGDASTRIDVLGSLIVDGTIEYSVKGSTSGTRIMQYVMMTNTGGSIKGCSVQGSGTIGAGYFQINKYLATDTVTIKQGITIVTDYLYIYKGVLNNSLNNIATYIATRFDNASVFMAQPVYRSNSNAVMYLGNSDITAGVELPDTIQGITTQYPTKVVTLQKSVVVTGQLNLANGRVNSGKYSLRVNGSVLNTGYSEKGFVMGRLEKPILTKSDTVKTYEVGSSKGYAEVNLKFFKLTPKGSLFVRTYEEMHKAILDTTLALKRFWTFGITDTVQFSQCEVTLRYSPYDFWKGVSEKEDESSLIVGQYDQKSGGWVYPKIIARDTSGAGGTIQITGVESLTDLVIVKDAKALSVNSSAVIPTTMELSQNYPNPFNPTTTISYQLSANSFTTLKVYDVIGREVATLVNEMKDAGSYTATFSAEGGSASGGNASSLSSGVYFYRLQSGALTQIKKMMLLK